MKIINGRKVNPFETLHMGDTFCWGGALYMKIESDERRNAVNLETGSTDKFFEDSIVEKVECSAQIEGWGHD